ncbi:hypothetical protein LIER_19336 [Lithospermum erythrorhizon]|uniref:Uncharacterized protein n=1 Tax=Lithospermum erythrorhizon TaxID=34254 RepID=A0AAV3QJZ2_LITER
MKRILISPALARQMTTWVVELSEFDITYVPRTSIKAQVKMEYALRFSFKAINNEAEYDAMIAGLMLVKSLGV